MINEHVEKRCISGDTEIYEGYDEEASSNVRNHWNQGKPCTILEPLKKREKKT